MPMNIIFPSHESLKFPVHYSFKAVMPNLGSVLVETDIPTACLKKDGTIKASICRLLRHPSTENKIKLRLKYNVNPRYTFEEKKVIASKEVVA